MHFYLKTTNKLNNEFRRHWPLISALAVLLVTTAFLLIYSLKLNQGHLIYALDDAYIHMAIAKNFALHGIWGVNKYQFSSSASSLLWPLLIAFTYLITGPNEVISFILNLILGAIAIFLVYYILRSYKVLPIYNFIILLAVIFFTPIPALIFMGMEHILQIILITSFVYLSARILANENSKPINYYLLLLLSSLLAMVRYESLILIFIIFVLFMLKRRFMYSFLIMGFAILPIVIYGAISISNGWSFLPNSLIIKSSFINMIFNTPLINLFNTVYSILISIELSPHIIVDLMAIFSALFGFSIAVFRFKKNKTIWEAPIIWLTVTGILIFIQLIFIDNNWLLRYTSYLVVLGLIAMTLGVYDYLPKKLSFNFNKRSLPKYLGIILLIILLFSPFAIKLYVLYITPQSTNDIYKQQYQMALFLKEYYPNDSVAANDIGAINYFTTIKTLDLVGLSSNDVAQAHKSNNFNQQVLSNISNQHQVKIAIIYEQWYKNSIPPNWIKVAEWTTPQGVALGNATVAFYATSPQYAAELLENLRLFSPRLPADIKQTWYYNN